MSLRASEAVIYGRYGFGMAGEYTEIAIDPARGAPGVRRRHGRHVSGCCSPTRSKQAVRPIYETPPTAGRAS